MATDTEVVHGTAPIPAEKGIHHAAITVKRPLADVESAIQQFGLPGRAELDVAPADKGVEIRVEVDEREDLSIHLLDDYKGHTVTTKLKHALRTIKAQIETGEIPTVDGQPSGRDQRFTELSTDDPMKALCWEGKKDVRVKNVPDPQILNPRDAIVRVTSTAICGSDLHLYNGRVPGMQAGDILGHEFMGEVVETGRGVTNLSVGDRVVVPFPISCGACEPCSKGFFSACDNTNPEPEFTETLIGHPGAGIFGYTKLHGAYAGGQAEFVRVPFADVGPLKVAESLTDEQVLFLSDIFPTGYEAAEKCEIEPGETVAIWGCGPVGQFAIRSAFMLGADRVIAIDRHASRLRTAELAGAETINYEDTDDLVELLKELTAGRGPDSCIDAVGMEAHGTSIYGKIERAKQAMKLELDNATVLRQAIQACGKGGIVSVPGVYMGFIDKFPFGAVFGKGLTLKAGQCNVHKYMQPLLDRIERGDINPPEIITHRASLSDAPKMYELFEVEKDDCLKVVLST